MQSLGIYVSGGRMPSEQLQDVEVEVEEPGSNEKEQEEIQEENQENRLEDSPLRSFVPDVFKVILTLRY